MENIKKRYNNEKGVFLLLLFVLTQWSYEADCAGSRNQGKPIITVQGERKYGASSLVSTLPLCLVYAYLQREVAKLGIKESRVKKGIEGFESHLNE